MGESSYKIISVIAVIIAIGSFGWLSYDHFLAPETSYSREYYDKDFNAYTVPSSWSDADYTNLLIIFTVNPGERVNFLYISSAQLLGSISSQVEMAFRIDGELSFKSECLLGDDSSSWTVHLSGYLPHYDDNMTTGTHSVTVSFKGTDSEIIMQYLYVEIFK